MPTYNIQNNTDQVVSVLYYDLSGVEQVLELKANEITSLSAISLHPSAVALVKKKVIFTGMSAQAQSISVSASLPTFRGKGMIWGNNWVSGATYQDGWVVKYAGLTYICTSKSISSTTSPDIDTANWEVVSIREPSAFLGVNLDAMPTGGGFFKNSAGIYEGTLVGDVNVSSLSQSKITGLESALSGKIPASGGAMTGYLTLHANPTGNLHASPKQYVDLHLRKSGGTMTGPITLHANPTSGLHAATKDYVDNASGVPLTGGTMTGPLILSGEPASALQASTKSYADKKVALAGGAMTGYLTLHANPTSGLHAATKDYADARALAGGAMTGYLTLFGAPTVPLHAATKAYVDLHLPKAGGTMSGPIHLSGDPTTDTEATRKSWVVTQLGDYIAKAGGTMSGPLSVIPPTSLQHAASKEYVDQTFAGVGGGLPLSGGVMTGPITGAHGLLQVDGTTPMTGALVLATLASSSTALYHSSAYSQLAYQNRMVVTRGTTVTTTSNLTVAAGTGTVIADCSSNSVAITLGDPSTYPASEVVIRRIGASKYQPVTVRGTGLDDYRSDLVLNRNRETIVLFPTTSGWVVIGSSSPEAEETEIDWISASVVSGTQKDITADLLNRVYSEYAIASVSDEGGGQVGLNASGMGTPFAGSTNKTNIVSVTGTSSYNATYEVESNAADKVNVTASFAGSETGFVRGIARSLVSQPYAVCYLLSDSVSNPHAGVSSSGGAFVSVSVGQLLGSGSNSLTVLHRGDARATVRVSVSAAPATVYLHALPAGRQWGSVIGDSENVTAVAKQTYAITGVTDEGSGNIGLSVADSSGISVGDSISVAGTVSYNSSYTVTAVTATKVTVAASFSGNETGTITSNNACIVTATRNTNLKVGEGIQVVGCTFLENSSDFRGIVEKKVGSTQVVVHCTSVNASGTTTGTAAALPIFRLTF